MISSSIDITGINNDNNNWWHWLLIIDDVTLIATRWETTLSFFPPPVHYFVSFSAGSITSCVCCKIDPFSFTALPWNLAVSKGCVLSFVYICTVHTCTDIAQNVRWTVFRGVLKSSICWYCFILSLYSRRMSLRLIITAVCVTVLTCIRQCSCVQS